MGQHRTDTPSSTPPGTPSGKEYPIRFISRIKTNGGQHAQLTPANLWRTLGQQAQQAGVKVSEPLVMFTGDSQLAVMGEAKSPTDIAKFNFVCSQQGLEVQTDLGYQPEVIEQQVQQLAGASSTR